MTANTANCPDYSDAAYSRGDTVTHGHAGMCVRSGHIGNDDRCDRCGALRSWAWDDAHVATVTGISFGMGDITIDGTVKRGSYGSDYFTLVVKPYGAVSGSVRGLGLPGFRFSKDDLSGWSPITVHGALLIVGAVFDCPVLVGGSDNNQRWLNERYASESKPSPTPTPEEASEAVSVEAGPVSDETAPVVSDVKRRAGVAGQLSVDATVTYPNEEPHAVSFVGNRAGGPVVMVTGEGVVGQTFVYDPNRFGSFADNPTGWVRRFFA